jgi:death-on-curing protein
MSGGFWYPEREDIAQLAHWLALDLFPDYGEATRSEGPIVRDEYLFEPAIAQPQWQYYESVFEKTAALFRWMIKNHPLIDGNKRLAVTSAYVFLRRNGYRITPSNNELVEFAVSVAESHPAPELAALAEWSSATGCR